MRDSGAASYSSNSHRPRSAALARNRSSAGRRTTACLRRHAGGDAHVPCVVAMDGRNHPEQRFPGLVGVAGSVACVGGGGYCGERPARALCVDDEPLDGHARRHLTTGKAPLLCMSRLQVKQLMPMGEKLGPSGKTRPPRPRTFNREKISEHPD
jgi:hypothetical protein